MGDLTPARWAVFFDRDGTLNEHIQRDGRRSSPRSAAELVLAEDAIPALSCLHAAGACLLVVTNQPDLARGLLRSEPLDELHRQLCRQLGISGVYVCPHAAQRGCECRKPASGLLRRAAAEHGVRLTDCYLVGDRATDAQAAVNAGVTAVLLGRHTSAGAMPHVQHAAGLTAAAWLILADRARLQRSQPAVHDEGLASQVGGVGR